MPFFSTLLAYFYRAHQHLHQLLESVEESDTGGQKVTSWAVTGLSMSSPARIEIAPFTTRDVSQTSRSISLVVSGLRSLNESSRRPPGFNDTALSHCRQLAALKDAKHLDDIKVTNGHSGAELTGMILAHVDELMTQAKSLEAVGAIEGKIDLISIHSGLQIGLYRIHDNSCVKAVFDKDDERTLEQVKALLGKRVLAVGVIKRGKYGDAKEIRIKSLHVVEPIKGNAGDIFGIVPHLTDGLSVEEFLRRQRGEQTT